MRDILTETARAKVNLSLRVLGRRADGYHDLESLVVFADIGDTVTVVPGGASSVTVTGPYAEAIAGENIAARALHRLAETAPDLTLGAVEIIKRLPVAAGIGGGSADAAAVLRAVRRVNAGAVPGVDWLAVAAGLGADVPVCLASTAQFMWDIGRSTAEVALFPALPAVLVNPRVPLATADVFRALAAPPLAAPSPTPDLPGPFESQTAVLAYLRERGNDLEPVARTLCPVVGDVLETLRAEVDVELVRMSGSGPTCFAIFRDAASAQRSAARLRANVPDWWIEATTLG